MLSLFARLSRPESPDYSVNRVKFWFVIPEALNRLVYSTCIFRIILVSHSFPSDLKSTLAEKAPLLLSSATAFSIN